MKYAIYHIWSYENLGSTLYKIPPNKKIIVAAKERSSILAKYNLVPELKSNTALN